MTDHQPNPTDPTDWNIKLLGHEFEYVAQSSFHTDKLRDQYIQFYILLTSAVLSGAIAVVQFDVAIPPAILSLIAILIGLIGFLEVFIFVRLRVVVIECMQASVLLKQYAFRNLPDDQREQFESAFLWSDASLPDPFNMLSASSLLVVLVIILDSAMFGAAYLIPQAGDAIDIGIAITLVLALVVLQILGYRWRLRVELEKSQYETKLAQLRAAIPGRVTPESSPS
jgi:hypothetical protein